MTPGTCPHSRSVRGRQSRRGAAAIVMVILLLVMNIVIIGLVLGGARDQDLTVRRVETIRAFYAAEAGMNMAMRELVANTDADGDGTVGGVSDDGNASNDPAIGPANVPQPQPIPRPMVWAFGIAVVGLVGFIGYRLIKKG